MSEPQAYHIALTDVADEADRKAVETGLVAFNATVSPHHAAAGDPEQSARPLDVYVRDDAGNVLGGLVGATLWGWLHIELLWLDERVRGQDYGTRLIETAEAEAIKRGCTRSKVTTFSFQARGFYEKQGYRVVGQMDDFPPGGAHYTLRKDFAC